MPSIDTDSTVGLITGFIGVSIFITLVYGWVMNAVTLINGGYEATSTIVMGFAGLFIPFVGPLTYFIAG